MNLTKVISTEFDSFKRRVIKVLNMGLSDIQTCDEASPFGIDSNPVKDMIAIYSNTSEMGSPIIIGYFNKNQISEIGEIRLFSTDSNGVEKTSLHLKNDGTIEVGGNTDNMVRFSALELAFKQFQTEFNAHTHASNGAPALPPSTADISSAKINEIKTI